MDKIDTNIQSLDTKDNNQPLPFTARSTSTHNDSIKFKPTNHPIFSENEIREIERMVLRLLKGITIVSKDEMRTPTELSSSDTIDNKVYQLNYTPIITDEEMEGNN